MTCVIANCCSPERSECTPTIEQPSEFNQRCQPDTTATDLSRDKLPWTPWCSREDFKLSEFAIEVALTCDQTDWVVKLIHQCVANLGAFMLNGHDEMQGTFEVASQILTPFKKHDLLVRFEEQNQTYNFEVSGCSLLDWVLDLLSNPQLQPHFIFDLQQVSKYDGKNFVQLIDDPWTANDF
ncbi:hypothetical protein CONPUDRAFT_62454 [Coniophora puteana RWD-64-598 SS2]|uniref:Uncharacterized protein n=1 Tax=Coniophora puteana (strain RWD-64-598) TaxID=741705 RepID=A0A5M3MD56_CONPW|nr:uncharacterized protein CONPUDRAFT_62454 [Coniophora puteana RWD-64-598 SS2]EIW77148.1 hypothetical protein CONPUDRAFT_62454 [Coniophora puteana RWD-64-598 SS2]